MDIEKICFNCNSFLQDKKDFDNGDGACLFDMEKFEPFVENIFENNDFSACIESYNENKVNGEDDACENYDQAEILDIDENATTDEVIEHIALFKCQTKNINEVEKLLYSDNFNENAYAVNELVNYSNIDNKMAYSALLDYFKNSEPALKLDEVNLRVKIIVALQLRANEKELVEYYINELLKTPSNNTTRKIFTEIFNYFKRCSFENIYNPILDYEEKSKCSYRIKSKISEILDSHYNKVDF